MEYRKVDKWQVFRTAVTLPVSVAAIGGCGETLVTVIPVPANIKKDMEKNDKEMMKDAAAGTVIRSRASGRKH